MKQARQYDTFPGSVFSAAKYAPTLTDGGVITAVVALPVIATSTAEHTRQLFHTIIAARASCTCLDPPSAACASRREHPLLVQMHR